MTTMKSFTLLTLAAAASAFVIPDAETAQALRLQPQDPEFYSIWDNIPSPEKLWNDAEEKVTKLAGCARHKIDNAIDAAYETVVKYDEEFQTAFAGEDWLANN